MRRCYVKLTVFYHSPNKLFLSGIFSDTAIMGYLSNFSTGFQKFLFFKNGQKVRVYRCHFYLKNRKSKRETKTHAMLNSLLTSSKLT